MAERAYDYRDLPLDERIKLVEDIWDSIADEANADPDSLPLSDAQRSELQRRLADSDANPGQAIPWARVQKELFKRGA
jgi:putative addiction module component (TIGR02574 family)